MCFSNNKKKNSYHRKACQYTNNSLQKKKLVCIIIHFIWILRILASGKVSLLLTFICTPISPIYHVVYHSLELMLLLLNKPGTTLGFCFCHHYSDGVPVVILITRKYSSLFILKLFLFKMCCF